MFNLAELSCSFCHFTTDNHEEWGNHVINAHCGSFQPIFPPYLAQFQYQQPQQQFHLHLQQPRFSFATGGPPAPAATAAPVATATSAAAAVKLERSEAASPYQGYFTVDEKENSSIDHDHKSFQVLNQPTFLQKNDQPSFPQQTASAHQSFYTHNPYQVVVNQLIRCPYCQYLGSTLEVLNGHVNAEHYPQEKVYSDLKPVHPDVATDHTQLINLVHQEPRQQVYLRERSPTQPTVFVQNNFIAAASGTTSPPKLPPVTAAEFQENSLVSLSAPPQIQHDNQDIVIANVPVEADQSLVNKINLVTIEASSDDAGIEGVVVAAATATQKSKKRRSKVDGGTERILHCEFCEKVFKRRDHLTKHVKSVHVTERNFECGFCAKKYTSETTLKQHVHNSHSQKLQQCQFCDKAFARKDHLAKHVQGVHVKERKYVCEHCGKSYTSQGALLQHVGKAHLEKKFECGKCGRRFATSIRLQIHVQETSLASNPHSCEICEERFPTESLMREHSSKSHKIKAWKCDVCGGSFKGRYILQAHIKKMHPAN